MKQESITIPIGTTELDEALEKANRLVKLLKAVIGLNHSVSGDGVFCLCQHFAVWYEQMKDGKQADFGAPCVSCRKLEECAKKNFPWDEMVLPILESHGIKIQIGSSN